MAWITTIDPENATGELAQIYQDLEREHGGIDNIMKMHSLRPTTLTAHVQLYKSVLHAREHEVERWFLEALGVLVSSLNQCNYCFEHHFQGMSRALKDVTRAILIRDALKSKSIESAAFTPKEQAALNYAISLTNNPADSAEMLVTRMRQSGWSDGAILEINQVIAYFAYVNRVVLGLGCSTNGEELGRSPAHPIS